MVIVTIEITQQTKLRVEIDVSSHSSSSCRTSWAVLFDNVDTAKMHGLDASNVLSRVESSQVEFGLIQSHYSSHHLRFPVPVYNPYVTCGTVTMESAW